MAQVAKTIALKFNHENAFFRHHPIDLDLVEFAGLAHDLGHPPFGHTGEKQLDYLMRETGGFEGNAQTLRILARLEKKQKPAPKANKLRSGGFSLNHDERPGLNLTYRTLASVLKYDKQISLNRQGTDKVSKGYYASEAPLVSSMKRHVVGDTYPGKFKTIECSIMDVADDIAYSTYDLEDAFKAGLLSPLNLYSTVDRMNSIEARKTFYAKIVDNVKAVYRAAKAKDIEAQALDTLRFFLLGFFDASRREEFEAALPEEQLAQFAIMSDEVCSDGYTRTAITSWLVNEAIRNVEVDVNLRQPSMSKARLSYDALVRIETLKRVAWTRLIDTRKLKIIERRERDIITTIFQALTDNTGYELLPDDCKELFEAALIDDEDDVNTRKRVVCDFIAGMSDRYAEGFYTRLKTNTDSVFLPF